MTSRVPFSSAAAAFVAAALGLSARPARAQTSSFGENHVVLRQFDWKVRSTEHFDIHYYDDTAPLVPMAAEILERSYRKESESLDTGFTERRPLFLYANPNDFEQSNIAQVGDGTGGITEPFKNRFMVYNDGTQQWFDDVLTHEMAHVFQYSVLISGFWKSVRILKTIIYPLWMMEGMAEFETGGLDDTTEAIYVRDAATSGRLIPLYKLEHFSALKPHQVTLAYKSGATALDFLESQYGKGMVGRMLKLWDSHFESSSVLQDLIGLDFMSFDKKWQEYTEERYRRVVRENRLREPTEFGVDLTTAPGLIPEFETSPVLTPDGRRMAYLSTRDGFPPEVVLKDLVSGKTKRLVAYKYVRLENIPTGNFTNISRVLAISADGKTLAFGAQKNHAQPLFLYDLTTGRLRRLNLPGLGTAQQPAFSPDGTKLVFSGMKGVFTDIYMLDLKTQELTALTSDPQDDQSPVFSPDGGSIVFSSEIRIPDSAMPYQRRLYRLSLADRSLEKLEDIPGAARDPVFSADGSRLLFTLEGWGFTDVYEMDMAARRTIRLTRTIGSSFTPIYAPNGDVVFSSFRFGSIHIYRAPRERLYAEKVPSPPRVGRRRPTEAGPSPEGDRPRRGSGDASASGAGADVGSGSPPTAAGVESLPGMTPLPGFAPGAGSSPEGDRPRRDSGIAGAPGAGAHAGPTAVAYSTAAPAGGAFLTPERPFKDSFGTDLFLPAFFYSSLGGLFWTSYWQGSDMLGNHQAGGIVEYNSGQGYLNYQGQYTYSRYRPEISLAAYGIRLRNAIDLASGLAVNESEHAQVAQVLYPLDRYHRIVLQAGIDTNRIDYPDLPGSYSAQDARLASVGFVRDTVGGRYLVETRGSRLALTATRVAPVLGGNIDSRTVQAEGHQFLPTGDWSAVALRAYAANSQGPNAQGFVLGGLGGVRGYARDPVNNVGTRMGVVNLEYRFPLLRNLDYYMWYIFPDFYFKAITAAVFTDAGYAWNMEGDVSRAQWNAVRNSYGVGLRIHTFILQLYPLVLSMDYARRTTAPGGIFYVYLGPLF